MKKRISVLLVTSVALATMACDPRSPNLDRLAIGAAASQSGSDDGLTLKTRQDWGGGDSATTSALLGETFDASGGFTIQEGTAAIISFVPIFDDSDDSKGLLALGGSLKLTGAASDNLDVQLLPKESRRFVVLGKKVGHVDLKVEVDSAGGAITVPIDIVPLGTMPAATTP